MGTIELLHIVTLDYFNDVFAWKSGINWKSLGSKVYINYEFVKGGIHYLLWFTISIIHHPVAVTKSYFK